MTELADADVLTISTGIFVLVLVLTGKALIIDEPTGEVEKVDTLTPPG